MGKARGYESVSANGGGSISANNQTFFILRVLMYFFNFLNYIIFLSYSTEPLMSEFDLYLTKFLIVYIASIYKKLPYVNNFDI